MTYDTLVKVCKAKDGKHKYVAYFKDSKTGKTDTTPFGYKGMEDYTMHKDKQRRENYRSRHKRDLRTNDPTRAGYLSYYILWGDSTSYRTNLAAFKKRFFPKSPLSPTRMKSPTKCSSLKRMKSPTGKLVVPEGKKIRRVAKEKESNLPKKYVPAGLSKKDKEAQIKSIKENKDRPKVDYKNKRSSHIVKFEKKYNRKITDSKWINDNLLRTAGQRAIIKKGEGAYYSGGSRPNQTPRSWGLARLASALTGGKAATIDKDILEEYGVRK